MLPEEARAKVQKDWLKYLKLEVRAGHASVLNPKPYPQTMLTFLSPP
jgi:hypothetical protein